jgi:hypothetical protein
MAATNAVHVLAGGCNQIGRLTAICHSRGGQLWRTAVVDEEVQNLEEKTLYLLQHFLSLVARLSKSTIGFQD